MNDVLGSERGKKIAKCNLAKRISSQSFYAVTGYFDSPAAVSEKSHLMIAENWNQKLTQFDDAVDCVTNVE